MQTQSAGETLSFLVEPHPAPLPEAERLAHLGEPGFGRVFSDHMVTIRWTAADGWCDARVGPRRPFQMDPASAVLHYAQEIFEGLKAYRGEDDVITLFRPDQNAARFNRSAERMAMPAIPPALFIGALEALIAADRAWVPAGEASLYLRPFMFAHETFLSVRPAAEYMFCVIASPAGAYFKAGGSAVTVWVSSAYSRAAPGGTGAAKCGGNYAAGLAAQAESLREGCDQVVFLDAAEHRWVEELGGMNVFFVMDDGSLLTPPLGTILPGITRASLIELARDAGLQVAEAPYAIDQWRADAACGRLREVFACGTAAVVTAIGKVRSREGDFMIADGECGPVTARLREMLTGVQRRRLPDTKGWVHRVG